MEDGAIIYLEASEDTDISLDLQDRSSGKRQAKGGELVPGVQGIDETIRTYTQYTLNALKQVAFANVEKVTLEFGIKVGGEAGIPYITKGTAESNLKITVECSFPSQK
jgi:Trypsin-co-occurring domain 1